MAQKHPLTEFRERHDPPLSQTALAQIIGVSKAAVSRWENRARFPERKWWPLIKAATGLSPEELSDSEACQ